MKANKAVGVDDLPVDVLKMPLCRGTFVDHLTHLFNRIVVEKKIPKEWTVSTTVTIYKGKGDTLDCSSYRPMRLLSHTFKLFERGLEHRRL